MQGLYISKKSLVLAILLAVVGVLSVGPSASAYSNEEDEKENKSYSRENKDEDENDWKKDDYRDYKKFNKHDKEDDDYAKDEKDHEKPKEEKPEVPVVHEEEQPPVAQVLGAEVQAVEQLPVTGPELFGQIAAASLAGAISFVAIRNRNQK